jgi:hypothetical protein
MSLQKKLLALSVGVLLIFGVINLVQFRASTQSQKKNLESTFALHSEHLSQALEAQFYERYGDVQAFAKNASFANKRYESHHGSTGCLCGFIRNL